MTEDIDYRIDDRVARVVIDRPQERNLMTLAALERLERIAAELRDDREVQAVVITGRGEEFFSSGLLHPDLKASLGKDKVLERVFLANRTFDAIEALPQVVIAQVNGEVRAGGAELMLACDIRIAAAHVRLSLPEAKWGGFPGAGAPVRLPLAIGYGRALELICTGRSVDAAEMERIGLIERVVPREQLAATVDELAAGIAAAGPLAIRGAKRIMRVRREPGFQAARQLSDALRHALEWTHDADEGVAAHRENRAPRFTGR